MGRVMIKKQAICITAYKDEDALFRLIRHFSDEEYFRIYIHIDKKSTSLSEERIATLGVKSLVCIRKYKICWGSINHLLALLDLLRLAMADESIKYVHMISGCDVALRSPAWFIEKFSSCQESYCDIEFHGHIRGREDWYGQWRIPSRWRFRGSTRLDRVFLKVQHVLGIRRTKIGDISTSMLSVGLCWGSHPRSTVEKLLSFAEEHPKFLSGLNFSAIPEETFFATVVYSQRLPFSPKGYLRYSVWSNERGNPAVLDERDIDDMYKGDYFFARKIDSIKSAKLLSLIDERLRGHGA